LNRNRIDDAWVLMSLRPLKVTLVSATENIDETPVGQLMHGILATINEFRSAEDGADIRFKMEEKARRGGTLGRAPLGYLNVRDTSEGRNIGTVIIDEERAPFVRLAFELFATGEYTLERLAATLTERGLRTRPGRFPAGPISDSKLSRMLRDRYYLGYTRFKGVERRGRHEPLISEELFEQVQLVLDARAVANERQRTYPHYLKGSLFCGRCHDAGRLGRMVIQRSVGRAGGEYFYFFCTRRQDRQCDNPYIGIDDIEAAVERYYRALTFSDEFCDRVRRKLRGVLEDEDKAARLREAQLTAQLRKLDVQEENLLDLATDAEIPKVKLRERLNRIGRERAQIERALAETTADLQIGAALLEAALDLLTEPGELYRRAGAQERRLLNQAIFEKLYVDASEVSGADSAVPFAELVKAHQEFVVLPKGKKTKKTTGDAVVSGTLTGLLAGMVCAGGSSRSVMVGADGLEPPTSSL
jgi:site-specific DNA recombinase